MQNIFLCCIDLASSSQLIEWSGNIGSDISFFFSSGTAYCTGRGEIVDSIPELPDANNICVHIFKPKYVCHHYHY